MSVSCFASTERLTEWTPSNVVDTGTESGFNTTTFHELELSYPGHYGKGYWVVTGDYRVTDRTGLGALNIHLWNDLHEVTYGVCGGYLYDTNWKQFSIVAGWWGDIPSTMHLMVDLHKNGATNVVRLRNVRLQFIQNADVGGLKVAGRDANTAGYHVQAMKWDYSDIAPLELESFDPFGTTNSSANLAVMTIGGARNDREYITVAHLNGLECYGEGTANNVVNQMDVGLSLTGSEQTSMRIRPMSGYYPSYGFINKHSSWGTVNGVRQPSNTYVTVFNASYEMVNLDEPPYIAFAPVANVTIDIYGGWFMMSLEQAANTPMFGSNNSLGSGDANTYSANLISNSAINDTSLNRSLYFGTGHTDASGNTRSDISVSLDSKVLHSANVTAIIKTSHGVTNNPHSYFICAVEVTDGNTTFYSANSTYVTTRSLRENIVRANGSSSVYFGPRQGLMIPIERKHVRSSAHLSGSGVTGGSGSRAWTDANNVVTMDTATYATQSPSATATINRYLQVNNFGFADHIPENAEIGFVWMHPVYRMSGSGGIVWDNVRMHSGGTAVGSSAAWSTPWTTSWSYQGPDINLGVSTYWTFDFTAAESGSASRNGIWDYRPTAAEVRDPGFGFAMRCRATSGTPVAQVAYVFAVVYYRVPGEGFNRVISGQASVMSVVDRDHDIGVSGAAAINSSASSAKSLLCGRSAGAMTIEAPSFTKGFGQVRALSSPMIATKLTTAIGSFKTVVANSVASVVKAITPTPKATDNVTYEVISSFREIGKAPFLDVIDMYEDRRNDIGFDVRELSANVSASAVKGVGNNRNVSVSAIVSRTKAVGKVITRSVNGTVRKGHAIGRSLVSVTAMTAALTKAKSTAYHIAASLSMSTTATSQKAIGRARSAGSILSEALVTIGRGFSIGGALSMSTTATSQKAIGSGKKVVSTAVGRVMKAMTAATDAQITTTVVTKKAIGKAHAFSIAAAAQVAKAVGRLRSRTVATVVTTRKAIGRSALVTIVLAGNLRKAVGFLEELSISSAVTGIKGMGKSVRRSIANTIRRQRAIGRNDTASIATMATARKAVGRADSATVSVTASLVKGIGQRTARMTVSTAASMHRGISGLLQVLRFNFRRISRTIATGDFTFKIANTAPSYHEQIIADLKVVELPKVASFTMAPPAAQAFEGSLPKTTIIKVVK